MNTILCQLIVISIKQQTLNDENTARPRQTRGDENTYLIAVCTEKSGIHAKYNGMSGVGREDICGKQHVMC